MFLLHSRHKQGKGESGSEGIPKTTTPEAEGPAGSTEGCRHVQGETWVLLGSLDLTHI